MKGNVVQVARRVTREIVAQMERKEISDKRAIEEVRVPRVNLVWRARKVLKDLKAQEERPAHLVPWVKKERLVFQGFRAILARLARRATKEPREGQEIRETKENEEPLANKEKEAKEDCLDSVDLVESEAETAIPVRRETPGNPGLLGV